MRTFHPWEVQDPAAMLDDVLPRSRAVEGDVWVALLSTAEAPEQTVVDVVRAHRGALPDRADASDLLRDHACRLVGPRPWAGDRWAPPQHVLVTVVCRRGRVVPGPVEFFWLTAWRYANHFADSYDGDVYLVTDHGWTGCIDRRAGFTPMLHPPAPRLSVVSGRESRTSSISGRTRP